MTNTSTDMERQDKEGETRIQYIIFKTVASNLYTNFKGMRKLLMMPKSRKEPWGERYTTIAALSPKSVFTNLSSI